VIYYLKCMFVKAFKNAPAFALYRIVLMMYGVRRLLRFLRAIARIFFDFFYSRRCSWAMSSVPLQIFCDRAFDPFDR
jgi:hypothetical protein